VEKVIYFACAQTLYYHVALYFLTVQAYQYFLKQLDFL